MNAASQNQGLRPANLEQAYLGANDRFSLVQTYANLMLEQEILGLPVDAGLAFKVRTYQSQLQEKSIFFNNQIMPRYIGVLASAQSFVALWDAFVRIDLPLLEVAYTNSNAKTSVSLSSKSLGDQANTITDQAQTLSSNLEVVNSELKTLDSEFDTAITEVISELSAKASAASAEIDRLKSEIRKNIDDIVQGANQVGGAVTQLAVGLLTTIDSNAGDEKTGEEEGDKTSSKKSTSSNETPSTDFAAQAIVGAAQGAEVTAQARADLEANNTKLAESYQTLAQSNGLLAIAKVVQVQSDLLTSAMDQAETKAQSLADTWKSIAPEFNTFATSVDAIDSQSAGNELAQQVRDAQTNWSSFHDTLVYLKSALTGTTPGS